MQAVIALLVFVGAQHFIQEAGAFDGDGMAPASEPYRLPYSGTLEQDGLPVTGDIPMRFSLFATEVGGTAEWTADFTVSVFAGRFDVQLGDIPPEVFSQEVLWLGVEVDEGGTFVALANRQRISSAPTAFANGVPAGTVVPFAGDPANLPLGWLPCDGRTVTREEYPNLFIAIGEAWGRRRRRRRWLGVQSSGPSRPVRPRVGRVPRCR